MGQGLTLVEHGDQVGLIAFDQAARSTKNLIGKIWP